MLDLGNINKHMDIERAAFCDLSISSGFASSWSDYHMNWAAVTGPRAFEAQNFEWGQDLACYCSENC